MSFTLPFTAEALLNIGRGEIGVHEDPPGSNRVKYNAWAGLQGQPWCVTLWLWCIFTTGGVKAPFGAYNPSVKAWAQKAGVWHPPSELPRPGDFIQYAFPGEDHVPNHFGIVEKVHGIRDVEAIEGNTDQAGGRTGGQVMRKHRTAADHIDGYIRPTYATSDAPTHQEDDDMPFIIVPTGDGVDPKYKDQNFFCGGPKGMVQIPATAAGGQQLTRHQHNGVTVRKVSDLEWDDYLAAYGPVLKG